MSNRAKTDWKNFLSQNTGMSPKEKKARLILELETQEMKCSIGQNL